jgi:O-antigen/teichoic acid export membrane protein
VLTSDETRSLIRVSALVVVCNLVLNFTLIPAYGPRGAAVATLGSYVCLCLATYLVVRGRESLEWLLNPGQLATALILLSAVTVLVVVPSPAVAWLLVLTGAVPFLLPPFLQRLRS